MDDLDKYIKQLITDGYIDENGAPLKCYCGCKDFDTTNEYYEEFGLIEYQLKCKNCGKKVGHWAYGNWEI